MTQSRHEQVVQRQFGAQANAYLSSAVHAQGEEFALLRDALAGRPEARVLDLGCGAGHVSFQVAALAGEVVAYDLSAEMLAVVAQSAAERGLGNIATEEGQAESLPFADGEFDFVFSRYSTHHWRDVGLALREVRRVLKPGGVACFVDVAAPGQALLDTYLQTVEVLRDTSHVRDYSPAEWARLGGEAGLAVTASQTPAPAPGVPVLGRADAYARGDAPGDPRPAAGGGHGGARVFRDRCRGLVQHRRAGALAARALISAF